MEEHFGKIVKIQKELRDAVSPAGKPYNICGIDPTPTYFDGNLLKGALIFYGGDGCSWNTETGGCFMCPYSTAHERIGYTQEHVRNQIEYLEDLEEIKDLELVYLFPYSSFDEKEVSFANQERLWKVLSELDNLKYVVFESRPEYITEKILEGISDILPDKKVCVYIGLETSCDFIRKYCINKGFSFDMFREKCELLQEYNMDACAFVLLKPPFLTEKEAITDCVSTITDCVDTVTNIILMCANTARHTITELLSEMGVYSPPWLWSVAEVIGQLDREQRKKVQLGGIYSEYTAEGVADYVQVDHTPAFYEFPKNCGGCDFDVAKSLIEFNLKKRLDLPWCRCKREWEKELQKHFPPLQERLPHLYEELIQYAASRREGQ